MIHPCHRVSFWFGMWREEDLPGVQERLGIRSLGWACVAKCWLCCLESRDWEIDVESPHLAVRSMSRSIRRVLQMGVGRHMPLVLPSIWDKFLRI